ncbi:MAG: nucleotidyltransferase family protein [Planctomycetota bacterium]
MAQVEIKPFSWHRMSEAIDAVRRRLERAAEALAEADVRYAVAGGNAVAAWVTKVDRAAVRFTQDVDLLVQRDDLNRIRLVLGEAGFVYRHTSGLDMFLEGPQAKARDAVHLIYAGEKVRAEHMTAAPLLDQSQGDEGLQIVSLDALVEMKLNSYRRKDQVHLLDMIGVGLIDRSWLDRVPTALSDRLRELLDDPEG